MVSANSAFVRGPLGPRGGAFLAARTFCIPALTARLQFTGPSGSSNVFAGFLMANDCGLISQNGLTQDSNQLCNSGYTDGADVTCNSSHQYVPVILALHPRLTLRVQARGCSRHPGQPLELLADVGHELQRRGLGRTLLGLGLLQSGLMRYAGEFIPARVAGKAAQSEAGMLQ